MYCGMRSLALSARSVNVLVACDRPKNFTYHVSPVNIFMQKKLD